MSTTFKKGWYLGKPLRELLPNTKYFTYWYLGKPYRLFDKPATPSVSVTAQIGAALHLSLSVTLYAPTIYWGWIVTVGIQSLTLSLIDPNARAGTIDPIKDVSLTAEVIVRDAPGVYALETEVDVLYSPAPQGFVSEVLVQAEYTESVVQIDQLAAVAVYADIPGVQINHLGVAVIYLEGVFPVSKVSLTLSLNEPTVVIVIREVSYQSLILTIHAPTITTVFNVVVPITTRHLTFSQYSPSVKIPKVLVVDLVSLYLTTYDPQVLIGAHLYETLDLLLAIFEPACFTSAIIIISASKHLTLTLKTPTLIIISLAVIDLVPLVLSIHEPVITTGARIYETLDLFLVLCEPFVFTETIIDITPKHLIFTLRSPFFQGAVSLLHLTLSIKNVTTYVDANAVCLPPLQSLILLSHDVEALTGASIKETLHLNFELLPASTKISCRLATTNLHLILRKNSPTIRIHARNPVATLQLILTVYDVEGLSGVSIKETLHLQLTAGAIEVVIEINDLPLILTLHSPGVVIESYPPVPWVPYNIDPLHKERQWGSSYDFGEGEYASRSGSALSSRFPLQSSDTDKQITVCCWVRFKSLSGRQTIFTKLLNNSSNANSLGLFMVNDTPYLQWAISTNDIQIVPALTFDDVNLVIDRWYHIGLVVDGLERTVYLHVWDDKAKTTLCKAWYASRNPYPISTLVVGNGDFRVGYFYGNSSEGAMWLNGYLDEFVVFNELKSPFEIDQIRLGRFNGPSQGQAIGDFGLTTSYSPAGKVTIADYGSTVAWGPAGRIIISDFGVSVGYRVEMPPPPSRFPVISGFPSPGTGTSTYTFCNITYRYKSDIFSYEYGTSREARASHFTLPVRELDTMIGIADESSYLRLTETLEAGAMIYSVPMWALRTFLFSNAHAADSEFVAVDVSNIYVGEKVLLVRANDATIYDLCTVTSIAGNTVHVETPLTLHHHKFQMPTHEERYDERSSYVVPCITGFVDVSELELKGSKPTWFLKVKTVGGAWINAGQPAVVDYMEAPADAGYISPKVEHTKVGTENGLMEMMPHMLTSKLAFQVEWYFIDDSWKVLRNHFIAAKGKAVTVPMPTWCFELRATVVNRQAGSTEVTLTSGFEHIWTRFPRLYVLPLDGTTPFVIHLKTVITDEIPWYSWNYDSPGHYIGVMGFVDYYPVPGTFHLHYEIPGVSTHDIFDDGEGNLVGDGVTAGHIIYSGRDFFFFLAVTSPASFNLTASYSYFPYSNTYACLPLEQNLKVGDKISLYPNVRFMEDELTFEFLYYNQCKVKASFIEVID
jgi:hypothetical protein